MVDLAFKLNLRIADLRANHSEVVQANPPLVYIDSVSFSEKQILDKERELRHLAKLTNEDLLIKQLIDVGFRLIQPFWRNYNFVGYIALKLPAKALKND